MILTRRAGVQFLVRELRSHKLCGAAKTRKKKKERESSLWYSASAGRWADIGQARLGYSASGCRPTGHSSSMRVGLRLPQVGSLWGPAKGQWLQGESWSWQRSECHCPCACQLAAYHVHQYSQARASYKAKPKLCGEGQGNNLPSRGRGR